MPENRLERPWLSVEMAANVLWAISLPSGPPESQKYASTHEKGCTHYDAPAARTPVTCPIMDGDQAHVHPLLTLFRQP
jgi:hypothetical protein